MGLLRRAEPAGYENFVAGRYREIVRFGVLLTGDGRLGEDLAQEGLIAAYRSWHRLGVPEGRPEAYVRQVMVRAAMRARRRRWRDEVPTGELPDASRGGFADQSDLSVRAFAQPAPAQMLEPSGGTPGGGCGDPPSPAAGGQDMPRV